MPILNADQRAKIIAIRAAREARQAVSAGQGVAPMSTRAHSGREPDPEWIIGDDGLVTERAVRSVLLANGQEPAVGNDGAIYWRTSTDAETDQRANRSRASARGRRTEHRRNVAALRSNTPASDGRVNTMARVRDGGMAQNYSAGPAGSYGLRMTGNGADGKRLAGRTFHVRLLVTVHKSDPPHEVRAYTDDVSADRTEARQRAERAFALLISSLKDCKPRIEIEESGTEPVRMPEADGARFTPMSTRAHPERAVTADPFDGTYEAWRAAFTGQLASIARELSPSARAGEFLPAYQPYDRKKLAGILRDYATWARRYGWTVAESIVTDAMAALRDDTMTGEGLAYAFSQAGERIPNVP